MMQRLYFVCMSCQVKKISEILQIKINEKQFDQLCLDLDNIMELIEKMKKVGQISGELYNYQMIKQRQDDPINIIQDKKFNPMLNSTNNSDNMFVVDGVIDGN